MTDTNDTAESTDNDSDDVNISRLREMAIRGAQFREEVEIEDYFGLDGTLYVKALPDPEFLPIAAKLEDRLDIETEEAEEMLEEERESGDDDSIDPTNFDEEFVVIMIDAAIRGIDTSQGIAEGEDEEGLQEIFGIDDDNNPDPDAIGLRGGLSLVIAERVLNITSDAENAESFRRDGGGE